MDGYKQKFRIMYIHLYLHTHSDTKKTELYKERHLADWWSQIQALLALQLEGPVI